MSDTENEEQSPSTSEGDMSVGELAGLTGVSTATINYYVNYGVLPRPRKTSRTRALYPSTSVERIRRIKELQVQGLPLRIIRDVLNGRNPAAGLSLAPAPTEEAGATDTGKAGARAEPARPAAMSADDMLNETGLDAGVYRQLLEHGLIRRPRSIQGQESMHDRRDINVARAFSRLVEAGVPLDLLIRHEEYTPLARAEADFLAEHLVASMDADEPPVPPGSVAAAFDAVRRYLRILALDSAYDSNFTSRG
ncbi:MAG: MerR family transcriptional regulator [Dehalococcoidia bacterium]